MKRHLKSMKKRKTFNFSYEKPFSAVGRRKEEQTTEKCIDKLVNFLVYWTVFLKHDYLSQQTLYGLIFHHCCGIILIICKRGGNACWWIKSGIYVSAETKMTLSLYLCWCKTWVLSFQTKYISLNELKNAAFHDLFKKAAILFKRTKMVQIKNAKIPKISQILVCSFPITLPKVLEKRGLRACLV